MKKIEKYLSTKKYNEYTKLDTILQSYNEGDIHNIFLKYDLTNIGIFYRISETNSNTIQLNFKYSNLVGTIDFDENGYEYIIYPTGTNIDELDKMFIKEKYDEKFSIDNTVEKMYELIQNNPELKIPNIKLKRYKIISNLSLLMPFIIIGVMGMYVILTNDNITLNPWFILVIVIPIVSWFYFDIKSEK